MPQDDNAVLSVKQLNVLAKDILESSFPSVLVEGEISNLAQPRSGHVYFSLKDADAQVRCALFAGQKKRLNFELENGQKVLVRGQLSLFAPRGDYQLILRQVELAGEGALRREFEQLKHKLESKGWFDTTLKKNLPQHCRHLAVITSPTGAAIRDILHVLNKRQPMMQVSVVPTLVQGKEAAGQIAQAIGGLNEFSNQSKSNLDLILLARGGGSLEDLWPFNEEQVAQAIYESKIPVISGIGHETDFTISDWVADYRAPTPSAAAETLSQDQDTLMDQIEGLLEGLVLGIERKLQELDSNLHYLSKRNLSPKQILIEQQQRLDYLEQGLRFSLSEQLHSHQLELSQASHRLSILSPAHKIELIKQKQEYLKKALESSLHKQIQKSLVAPTNQLTNLAKRLNSVSPLNTLDRGYSITRDKNDSVLDESSSVKLGETISTEFSHSIIESQVTKISGKIR